MPNWCATTVIFTGDKSNLKRFHSDFMKAQRSITEGDPGWIGKLLVYKGIDWKNVDCRGFYDYIRFEDDHVTLDSEDAWGPCTEVYDIFAKIYNLSYVLKAEEPGCGVYINTDIEGQFFPEKYIFEVYDANLFELNLFKNDTQLQEIFKQLDSIRYFENDAEILDQFKDYKNREIKTLGDFKKLIKEYKEYVSFGEFVSEI